MVNIYRILVVITTIVTGLAGSLTILGISAFITYYKSFEGDLWGVMCYTNLILYFLFFVIIYIFGFILLVIYTKEHDKSKGKDGIK